MSKQGSLTQGFVCRTTAQVLETHCRVRTLSPVPQTTLQGDQLDHWVSARVGASSDTAGEGGYSLNTSSRAFVVTQKLIYLLNLQN